MAGTECFIIIYVPTQGMIDKKTFHDMPEFGMFKVLSNRYRC